MDVRVCRRGSTCAVEDFLEERVGRERVIREGGDWRERVGWVSPRRIRGMEVGE